MVAVMGCFVWWVDLGGVGIRGSRYFPKAGILHPEAWEIAWGRSPRAISRAEGCKNPARGKSQIWRGMCWFFVGAVHCSKVPWGPNFVQNADPMGTQFWVRWGPNGDLCQHKWGHKKRFLKIYLNELISLKYRGEKNVGKHLQIVWLHLVCRCTGLN